MPSFPPTSFIYALVIVANVMIAAFVYANDPKSATNKIFLGLSASVSIWLTFMLATSIDVFLPWYLPLARMTLVLATPMNVLFFLFARTVPDERMSMKPRNLAILLAAAGVIIAAVASPLAFIGLNPLAVKPETLPGPALPLFGMFSAGLNIAAVVTLFVKARRSEGSRRLQLRLVTLGILSMFGMIFGTIFVPILLLGDSTFVNFAPLYVLLFTGMTGYAIFRRRLLDVKVVTAEVFSAVLVLINAVQLCLSTSYIDFGFRLVTLIFVGGFSFSLIKSVRAEVRRREEFHALSVQLAQANEELKQTDQLKSEFISIASHQLRTPISVIKGYLSLILEDAYGKVDGLLRTKIEQMFEMNERLVQMVDNMLNVSRIERNRLEFSCGEIDVRESVQEAIQEMTLKARQKGITLVHVDPPDEPVMAFVDSEKLLEIFTNLIDNAIKFTPTGSIEIQLQFRSKTKDIFVTVKDSGVGMVRVDADRLFQKFFRASRKGVGTQTGTGLGLYVCAMFLKGMGGDIWVERTSPGKGTTVAFLLPTAPKQECIAPKSPSARRNIDGL